MTVLTEVPQAGKANPYVEYLCISVRIHICPFQIEGMQYGQLAIKWLCGYLKGWGHIRDLALWLAVWRSSDSLGKWESMLSCPMLVLPPHQHSAPLPLATALVRPMTQDG